MLAVSRRPVGVIACAAPPLPGSVIRSFMSAGCGTLALHNRHFESLRSDANEPTGSAPGENDAWDEAALDEPMCRRFRDMEALGDFLKRHEVRHTAPIHGSVRVIRKLATAHRSHYVISAVAYAFPGILGGGASRKLCQRADKPGQLANALVVNRRISEGLQCIDWDGGTHRAFAGAAPHLSRARSLNATLCIEGPEVDCVEGARTANIV